MFNWPGIGVQLDWQSGRTGIENNWYALTGRVAAVKVEADDDLHIALQNAIRKLNDEGMTIVQVTHSEKNASYGKRIIQLRDGWIVNK